MVHKQDAAYGIHLHVVPLDLSPSQSRSTHGLCLEISPAVSVDKYFLNWIGSIYL